MSNGNPVVSNPKDFVVVTFHNSTDFDFTPEMGCMYDGRPINGKSGNPGIAAGESKLLPYHVGKLLSVNLAKRVFNTSQPATVDPAGIPTGVPIWNATKLNDLASTFVKEEYSDDRPAALTETDKLMQKVADLEKFVRDNLNPKGVETPAPAADVASAATEPAAPITTEPAAPAPAVAFKNKQEVITELEVRGIAHDKRQTKAELEKLLA